MRVSREKFAENRERLLSVAGVLFRENGFDGVGVGAEDGVFAGGAEGEYDFCDGDGGD